MQKQYLQIGAIPAILWGEQAQKAYIFVHGKMSDKESALPFAEIAVKRGYQVLSFDLPAHGQRSPSADRCDIWNGMRDLAVIQNYAAAAWESLSLFGCSLGAFFSLHTYHAMNFENCLFQSPVVDMEYLMGKMCTWFVVSVQDLEEKKEIETPIDTLSWPYFQYVKAHPVTDWTVPTHILYGAKDALQSRAVVDAFARRFSCQLTVSESSDHPFMAESDDPIVRAWMERSI